MKILISAMLLLASSSPTPSPPRFVHAPSSPACLPSSKIAPSKSDTQMLISAESRDFAYLDAKVGTLCQSTDPTTAQLLSDFLERRTASYEAAWKTERIASALATMRLRDHPRPEAAKMFTEAIREFCTPDTWFSYRCQFSGSAASAHSGLRQLVVLRDNETLQNILSSDDPVLIVAALYAITARCQPVDLATLVCPELTPLFKLCIAAFKHPHPLVQRLAVSAAAATAKSPEAMRAAMREFLELPGRSEQARTHAMRTNERRVEDLKKSFLKSNGHEHQ